MHIRYSQFLHCFFVSLTTMVGAKHFLALHMACLLCFTACTGLSAAAAAAQNCSISDISIDQYTTGLPLPPPEEKFVEFQVVITNKCACPQSTLILTCLNFGFVERVNLDIIDPLFALGMRDACLINNGQEILKGQLNFTYVAAHPIYLAPKTSTIKKCKLGSNNKEEDEEIN